jgi:hypothetical protein
VGGTEGRHLWLAPVLAVALLAVSTAGAAASAPGQPASVVANGDPGAAAGEGLSALADLPVLNPGAHDAGASSHDPDGENFDYGNYLYQNAQGAYVLMESNGPGVIDRIWMTGSVTSGKSSSVGNFGDIEIFFDGQTTPSVDLPADTFFSGTVAPFLSPLCGNGNVSSGGFYCDVRMPFAKSVKVVTTGDPSYYNIGYETYPTGTPVVTFDPASSGTLRTAQADVAMADRAGTDPGILPAGPTDTGSVTVPPGATQVLARVPHAGTIGAITVSVAPHDDAALHDVWLQATWDGSAAPAVDAPLADVFLSGAGERSPARGLLAGYLPSSHTGYLYFPMPFAHSALVDVVNHDSRPITVQWMVQQSTTTYAGVGSAVGEFHATYAQQDPTLTGQDYVMLDQPGEGKVVGVSYTEQGAYDRDLPVFMEGNEHVYFDGSQTPAINGTGTEDFFDAGYYYAHGPFTLFDHGATDLENASLTTGRTSQYRLLLQDPWNFRDGIVIGIQHGAGDGVPTSNRSVVFWYGSGVAGMVPTDTIDVGSPGSLAAAGYSSTPAGAPEALTSFYEGQDDGNITSPALDAAIEPGSLPPLPGTDPRGEAVTQSGLTHRPGSIIRFTIEVDPDNNGIVLRRRLDQATFEQQAQILVDGMPAGTWMTPANTSASGAKAKYATDKRWADSDFPIPADLSRGKSRLSIELKVLAPPYVPPGLPDGWTDFRYTVFSVTP